MQRFRTMPRYVHVDSALFRVRSLHRLRSHNRVSSRDLAQLSLGLPRDRRCRATIAPPG
jgi:hypothetical protein